MQAWRSPLIRAREAPIAGVVWFADPDRSLAGPWILQMSPRTRLELAEWGRVERQRDSKWTRRRTGEDPRRLSHDFTGDRNGIFMGPVGAAAISQMLVANSELSGYSPGD